MSYISGFLTPVEDGKKDEYIASAREAWPLFREYGATRQLEGWGDDVPEGKQTDFRRAVDLKDGETVVFSWIEWPDKATADKCYAAMESDERFQNLPMPFDGKRMVWGGFAPIFDEGAGPPPGAKDEPKRRIMYVNGFILAVPEDNKAAYKEVAEKFWDIVKDFGATAQVECWEADVQDGHTTDFRRAVQCKDGEKIVFSWVTWPDKATSDASHEKMMADPRMEEMGTEMPFDGKRMVFGGFEPLVWKEA